MRLFLFRHAHAKDTSPDAERELSDRGKAQIAKLCASLDPRKFGNVVQIWHSPYLRAEQSARLFKDHMGMAAGMVSTPGLTPDGNPRAILRATAPLSCFGGDLMMVAHNPVLERMLDILLSDGLRARGAKMGKCALASLELYRAPGEGSEYGSWTLDFLVAPSLLK